MKAGSKLAFRIFALLVASALVITAFWVSFTLIRQAWPEVKTAHEPHLGPGGSFTQAYFVTLDLRRLQAAVVIPLASGAFVTWGWIALFRDLRRH